MARLLVHEISPEDACVYLPGRSAAQEYQVLLDVTPADLQTMIERGWRRFGPIYFRPACTGCMECVSLRVPVADFSPSKSQRRARRRSARLRISVSNPVCDRSRIDLYAAWHRDREQRRGWPPNPISEVRYTMDFCFPHPCAREIAWFDGDRLVAVDIVDQTREALSSIFFFFDPAYRRFSLGVASALFEIEWARRQELRHVYFGYRVRGCPSMRYKEHFRPHELLSGRPSSGESPLWTPAGNRQDRQ